MACTLLRRLFRRRTVPASAFTAPNLISSRQQAPSDLSKLTQDIDFLLLSSLPFQGFYCLSLTNVPESIGVDEIYATLSHLTGFASISQTAPQNQNNQIVINFQTSMDAAMALATNPTVHLRGINYSLQYADQEPDTSEPARKKMKVEDESQPGSVHCKICSDKLEGPYATLCLFCKTPWCYDCVQNFSTAALKNAELFPALCCGKVLHFDAFKSIISAEDYAKYRQRYEEFITVKPLYCAKPDCSTFLPIRLAQADAAGCVACPKCETTTCEKCREVVADTKNSHECSMFDPTAFILENYSYKRCPRCNTGVAKMFGCSHIRCQCGAHWCWDCQRPVQICWSRPCESSREDGNETDDDFEHPEDEAAQQIQTAEEAVGAAQQSEAQQAGAAAEAVLGTPEQIDATIDNAPSVQLEALATAITGQEIQAELSMGNLVEQAQETEQEQEQETEAMEAVEAAEISSAQIAVSANAGSANAEQSNTELGVVATTANDNTTADAPWSRPQDDLDRENYAWREAGLDFGDEPVDESQDVWGCLHRFKPLRAAQLPANWLQDSNDSPEERRVTCLHCFEPILITAQPVDEAQVDNSKGDKKPGRSRPDSGVSFHEIASGPATVTLTREKHRNKKKHTGKPFAYDCNKCGVMYCVACKKSETYRLSKSLKSYSREDDD